MPRYLTVVIKTVKSINLTIIQTLLNFFSYFKLVLMLQYTKGDLEEERTFNLILKALRI